MRYSITPSLANRVNSPDPEGWVETDATREILAAISGLNDRHNFMAEVALLTKYGWSRDRIQAFYSTCRKEDIRGYPKPPGQGSESETRLQRSGDPRQARPSGQIGGAEGRMRGNVDPSPYASRAGSNTYASAPGFQGPGPTLPGLSWSGGDPRSNTANPNPYDRSFGSDNGRSGSYDDPAYGHSSNNYGSGEAGATPSGNRSSSGFTPYQSGRVHPSWTERSSSTFVDPHASSPRKRASGGSKQGRRDSRRAYQ